MTFFSHQRRVCDFFDWRLWDQDQLGAGCIGGLGIGKTRATLEFIERGVDKGRINRALIIAPPRVAAHTWPSEHTKHGYTFPIGTIDMQMRSLRVAKAITVSCDSLHKVAPLFDSDPEFFDLLIVDEATKFKSWMAKTRMKTLRKYLPNIPQRITLTGTPRPQSSADLFAQAFILDNGEALGTSLAKFRARYMVKGGFRGREWLMVQGAEEAITEAVKHLYITLKSEDYVDLPEKVVNDILVDLPPTVGTMHRNMKRELAASIGDGTILAPNGGAAFMKLRQIANGFIYNTEDGEREATRLHKEKIKAVTDIIDNIGGDQAIIVYNFDEDKKMLSEVLDSYCLLESFESWLKKQSQIMLAQSRSVAHGLNLQTSGAKHLIYFGLDDSVEYYLQSIGRLFRPGGAKHIFIHRILAANSVDTIVAKRLDGRIDSQAAFIEELKAWSQR